MKHFVNGILWYGSLGFAGELPPEVISAELPFVAGGFIVAITITLVIGVCL